LSKCLYHTGNSHLVLNWQFNVTRTRIDPKSLDPVRVRYIAGNCGKTCACNQLTLEKRNRAGSAVRGCFSLIIRGDSSSSPNYKNYKNDFLELTVAEPEPHENFSPDSEPNKSDAAPQHCCNIYVPGNKT
jgi:hypothetical protein